MVVSQHSHLYLRFEEEQDQPSFFFPFERYDSAILKMEYRFYKVKNTIISLLLISVEVVFVNSASSAGKRYLATLT